MARRRKSDTKPAAAVGGKVSIEKPQQTATTAAAVRKSRRQIAKKQLDKKVNGEATTTRTVKAANESEDLQSTGDPIIPVIQHKKFGKLRRATDDGRDAVSNTPQISSQEVVRTEVVEANPQDPVVEETQCEDEVVWQEDVIEETIEICEEMEVEDDGVERSYTISEEGSVLLEEVLLVNNHDFEGEGVVEFTVIRNEDGTESVVVARDEALCEEDKIDEVECEEFKEIEKGVGGITVEEKEPENWIPSPKSIDPGGGSGSLSKDVAIIPVKEDRENCRDSEVKNCDKLDSGIPFLETQTSEGSDDVKNSEKSFLGSNSEVVETKGDEQCREKQTGVEESSGDSEVDTKADTEDIKVSSSSDNSNDTLLSTNSYKLPEFNDVKNIPNQLNFNEPEKKTGFRSRSGSTDTTGSESGSNSSGVRRSSRIRTIGLMKQRFLSIFTEIRPPFTFADRYLILFADPEGVD